MRRGGQQNKTQQANTHASRARERLTEKSFVACCSKKLQRACNNNNYNMRNIQKKRVFLALDNDRHRESDDRHGKLLVICHLLTVNQCSNPGNSAHRDDFYGFIGRACS